MEKSGVSVVVDGVSCFELRLDHTKSLNFSTRKLVPFLSLRERNANIGIANREAGRS